MLRKPLYSYPYINRHEIVELVRNCQFIELSTKHAFQTKFFQEFKDRYNGIPIFKRYTCEDVEKFKRSIPWFTLEPIEVDNDGKFAQTNEGKIRYDYNKQYVDAVIFAMLNNKSLKRITNLDGEYGFTDLDEHNNTLEKFGKDRFDEINPLQLDGEFADLAMQGSIYCSWEFSASETKAMVTEFVDLITEKRYEDFRIYRSFINWREYGLGFFVAYFLFDEEKGEFWILSKDDYD